MKGKVYYVPWGWLASKLDARARYKRTCRKLGENERRSSTDGYGNKDPSSFSFFALSVGWRKFSLGGERVSKWGSGAVALGRQIPIILFGGTKLIFEWTGGKAESRVILL